MNALTHRAPSAAIYVDDAVHSWRGRLWAHMFSPDIEELHIFAARLGLRRDWFQKPPRASWPHYDVSHAKRLQAIKLGAVPADRATTLEIAWRLQGTLTPARAARLATYRASQPSTDCTPIGSAQISFPGL